MRTCDPGVSPNAFPNNRATMFVVPDEYTQDVPGGETNGWAIANAAVSSLPVPNNILITSEESPST